MTIVPALINKIRSAKNLVALTGAGISSESGIPTFRDAQTGLWAKYNPKELATLAAFSNNPKLVWEWYSWRRKLIKNSKPNKGHYILAEIERKITQEEKTWTLITQNVDGLHQLAGSKSVIELHGNIMRQKCLICEIQSLEKFNWNPSQEIPGCSQCSGLLRPDVTWFGEGLPQKAVQLAWEKTGLCDLFFSIGTSSNVQPAASLPILAKQNQSIIVEINVETTHLSPHADFVINGKSGQVLEDIFNRTWGEELTKQSD